MKKVVVFGMSCVGKTTYAKSLGLPYFCFDYLFPWDLIETFPEITIDKALKNVIFQCEKENSYVLDGWHLADLEGNFIPEDCEIHILYDSHKNIIDRYRTPVISSDQHFSMYKKWYWNIDEKNRHKYYKLCFGRELPEPTTYEHFNNFCKL